MCMCEYITCIIFDPKPMRTYVAGSSLVGWKQGLIVLFFQPPTDGRVYVSFGEGYSPRLLMIFMMLSVLPSYLR